MNTLKVLISVFFFWSTVDRFISTFKKASFSQRNFKQRDKIFSMLVVSIYSLIALDSYLMFLNEKTASPLLMVMGIGIYLIARKVRTASIKIMGRQWINHASVIGTKKIIKHGPYKYSRHPYYWSTILDLFAYAMIFGVPRTAIFTIFVFLPIILFRVHIEEKRLEEHFGFEYEKYKKETPLFLLFKTWLYNVRGVKHLIQLLELTFKFSLSKVILMQRLKHTISQYSRGYAVSRIVGALIEIGFVENVLNGRKIDLREYCDIHKIDFETLRTLCDYLSVVGILKKNGLTYTITHYGEIIFRDTRGAVSLLYAYMPVFEALPEILLGRKKYGKDVFRRIDFVGIGSNELSALLPFPYATYLFNAHKVTKVLDVGCGAGDFLLHASEQGISGCGIDISEEAIRIARERSKNIKLASHIDFQVCDLNKLHLRAKDFKTCDVIAFMFVLHEFLADNHEAVIRILKDLKEAFPAAKVFVSEVYKVPVPELIKTKPSMTEHHLFHRLSKQGLATLFQWRNLFRLAGYSILEEKRLDLAAQVYFLLTPDQSQPNIPQ